MKTKKISKLELREYILPKQIELIEDKINELVEAFNSLNEVSEKVGQPKPSKSGELKPKVGPGSDRSMYIDGYQKGFKAEHIAYLKSEHLKQSIIKALKKKYSYSEKLTLEEVLEIINSHWEGNSEKDIKKNI